MTTEIVIMNKEAVALAADSALTTGASEGKVFHSAQKLFRLGRHHSVGIMIYQNAEFMGVPWETIIEIYKDRVLRQKSFKTFKAYANSFMRFLDKANDSFNDLFSESDQEEYFASIVSLAFEIIRDWIIDIVGKEIRAGRSITHQEIARITEEAMQTASSYYQNRLKNNKKYRPVARGYLRDVEQRYKRVVLETEKRILEKLPISQALRATVGRIAIDSFALHYLDPEEFWEHTDSYSGVVIAGFGEDDKFPSLESYKVGGIVGGKLIYLKDDYYGRGNIISSKNKGGIFPFAQESMIRTFLTGIDPTYEEGVVGYFEQKAKHLCKAFIDTASNISEEEKRRLQKQMERKIDEAKEDYQSYIWRLGFRRSIPIEAGIVTVLPKGELASMAETLVSLASFERRVSPGLETVGGPIDVAVISRTDGFIWVKKKRYFTLEMNPHHMEVGNDKAQSGNLKEKREQKADR